MVGRWASPAPHTFAISFCSLRQKRGPLLRPSPALQHTRQMDRMRNGRPACRCCYFHLLPGPWRCICGDSSAGGPRPPSRPGVPEELTLWMQLRVRWWGSEMRHHHLAGLENQTSRWGDRPASFPVGAAQALDGGFPSAAEHEVPHVAWRLCVWPWWHWSHLRLDLKKQLIVLASTGAVNFCLCVCVQRCFNETLRKARCPFQRIQSFQKLQLHFLPCRGQ